MRKIYFGLLFLATLCANIAVGVPAYPHKITYHQPDGSVVVVQLHGDEYFSYTTADDGSLVSKRSDGYYYYASFNGRGINVSNTKYGQGVAPFASRSNGAAMMAGDLIRQRRAEYWQSPHRTTIKLSPQSRATKTVKCLVLLVQFKDIKFHIANPKMAFSNMLNKNGYSENGATGSVNDYFTDNLVGTTNFDFVVSDVLTLSQNEKYYGENGSDGNDTRAPEMVVDACKLADATINFAEFANKTGVVDYIYIYYAGYNEAEGAPADMVWPHSSHVYGKNVVLDGVRLNGYACSSELRSSYGARMTGIGTFCHEFGHVLDLLDVYDVDYEENGLSVGQLNLSLMSNGNYNNEGRTPPCLTILERQRLGISAPQELTTGNYSLEGIHKNKGYKIETGNPGEYFLVEARDMANKWDKFTEVNSSGLLIYHIDQSSNAVGNTTAQALLYVNMINAYKSHMCAYLICASGASVPNYSSEMLFPYGSNNKFNRDNGMVPWGKMVMPQSITNIKFINGAATFSFAATSVMANIVGEIVDKSGKPIAGARVLLSGSIGGASGVPGNLSTPVTVITDAQGLFTFKNIGLGDYKYVVSKDGYESGLFEVTLVEGDNNVKQTLSDAGGALVTIVPYQRHAKFSFETVNPESKPATIICTEVGTTTGITNNCGAVTSYLVGSLSANKAYSYVLNIDGVKVREGLFVTLPVVSSFMAIGEVKKEYKIGDVIPLIVFNAPNGVRKTAWSVNGSSYSEAEYTLTGNTTLRVDITLADNSIETITRNIKVK